MSSKHNYKDREYDRRRSRSPDRRSSHRDRYYESRSSGRHSSRQQHSRSPARHSSRSPERDRRDRYRDRDRDSYRHGGRDGPPSASSGRLQQQQQRGAVEKDARPLSRWERLELEEQEERQQHETTTAAAERSNNPRQQQQQQQQQQRKVTSPAAQVAAAAASGPVKPVDSQALVRQMMQAPAGAASRPGASGTSATAAAAAAAAAAAKLTQQYTTRELWGAKRDAAAAGVAPAFGANRWDLAEFSDDRQKTKFQRLLGAHKAAASATVGGSAAAAAGPGLGPDGDLPGPRVLRKDEQQRVLSDVERQFVAGLRRADGRTVGLGL